MGKIKSLEDLEKLYATLKYRVLNKDTNHPYFNTNFDTFDNWHLLSPEQIKKHRIGICYDTAAMTDAVLNELGIEHENRFAHSNTDGDWTQDPTHAYNIYKDKDGNWRWIEGSWGDYKGNDWTEKKKVVLLRKIKKALADAAGKKQTVHKVDKFPEPGIAMKDFYEEMLKNPVKKAEEIDPKKLARARKFVDAVNRLAKKKGLNFFLVTDGASGISNNGNPAVRSAREAHIKWELEHGSDPYEDWSKQAQAKITPDELIGMAKTHYPDSGSHGWNHIEDVIANAERIRRRKLLLKELAAVAYHDSSLSTGSRETHADDSAAIAADELKSYFKKRQLNDIINAIAHHRASYEGKRKSVLEDLVAAADRDVPDVEPYIRRSYAYGLEHGMTPDEAVQNTLHHMPDKYGTNGYAYKNVPKIYLDTYGDAVRKAQEGFDRLTEEDIRRVVGLDKNASYSLKKDPTYEDVAKVFDRLSFEDRANIAPRHPDFLRDVPKDMLFDRQVVIDENGNPVGFNEFYSRKDKVGRRLPPHNSMGVVQEARGNGLAKLMVEQAIRKAKKEKIKRLVWEAFADNEPSIRAALSAGFEDKTPKNAKEYRRFVYRISDDKSEKNAAAKKETYTSGSGRVVSFIKNKTTGHDEIVIQLKNGKKLVISNNTLLGKPVEPEPGSELGFNGYQIDGTDVVHKVHPNKHQRGGWLELKKDYQ